MLVFGWTGFTHNKQGREYNHHISRGLLLRSNRASRRILHGIELKVAHRGEDQEAYEHPDTSTNECFAAPEVIDNISESAELALALQTHFVIYIQS